MALSVALNRTFKPQLKGREEEDNAAIGQAEGLARSGKWDEARQKAGEIKDAVARLRAHTALAAAGDAKSDNPDLNAAVKLATGELQQKAGLTWLKLHVAELAARAGVEKIDELAGSIEDRALADRARLAVLRHKIASKSANADSSLLSEPPTTLSHYLARLSAARYKHSFDGGKVDEGERAFGTLGALLGSLDK